MMLYNGVIRAYISVPRTADTVSKNFYVKVVLLLFTYVYRTSLVGRYGIHTSKTDIQSLSLPLSFERKTDLSVERLSILG